MVDGTAPLTLTAHSVFEPHMNHEPVLVALHDSILGTRRPVGVLGRKGRGGGGAPGWRGEGPTRKSFNNFAAVYCP
jgi:hypothetical protein